MSLTIGPRKPGPCPISIIPHDTLVYIVSFAHAHLKQLARVCKSFRAAAIKASFAPSIKRMMGRAYVIYEKNIVASGSSKGFLFYITNQEKGKYIFSSICLRTGSVFKEHFQFEGTLDPSIYLLSEMGFVIKKREDDQFSGRRYVKIPFFYDFQTQKFIEVKMFDESRGIYAYMNAQSLVVVERNKVSEYYPLDTEIYTKIILVEDDRIFLGHREHWHGLIICRLNGKRTEVTRYHHGNLIPIPDGYLLDNRRNHNKKFVIRKDLSTLKVNYGFETNLFSKYCYADGRIFGFNHHSYLEHTFKTRRTTQDYISSPNYHPIRFVKVSFPLAAFGFYNVVTIWNLSSKITLFTKHFGDFVRIEALFFDKEALTVLLDDSTIHIYTQMDIMKGSEIQSQFEDETSSTRLTAKRVARMATNLAICTYQYTAKSLISLYKWAIPPDVKIYKTIL